MKYLLAAKGKEIARILFSYLYYFSGQYKKIHKGNVLILTYHRILPRDELYKIFVQPGMYVEESVFEKQVQFLKTNYSIISFSEYLSRMESDDWDLKKQYCIITFDDGWKDNYDYAFPILKRYNVPATIFLATFFIGTNDWFWPERISRIFDLTEPSKAKEAVNNLIDIARKIDLKHDILDVLSSSSKNRFDILGLIDSLIISLKVCPSELIWEFIEKAEHILDIEQPDHRLMLSWDEVREMSDSNVAFGSHGCRHKILTLLSDDEIKYEIETSQELLKHHDLSYIPVFCYPNGNHNENICRVVSGSGYHAAVTTRRGTNSLDNRNTFLLNRVGVHNDISKNIKFFSLHLSGILNRKRGKINCNDPK